MSIAILATVLLLLVAHIQAHRELRQNKQNLNTKDKDEFIFTTIAVASAAYGLYQGGDAIVKHIKHEEHVKAYKEGLSETIAYALDQHAFDAKQNNMAIVAIMNGWDNCVPLRGYSTAVWKELLKKRHQHKKAVRKEKKAVMHVLEEAADDYNTGILLESAAEDAVAFFDGEHDSAAVEFLDGMTADDMEGLGNIDVDSSSAEAVLLSLTVTSVKLFAKASTAYSKEHSLAAKRKNEEYSKWFADVAGYTGTAISIVGALFDPTGLSLLSLAGSVAGTAGQESVAAEERAAWREHYCPALDDAFLEHAHALKARTGMIKEHKVGEFFGPITNNVDCLERTTRKSCEMPVVLEAKQRETEKILKTREEAREEDDDAEYEEDVSGSVTTHFLEKGGCHWNENPGSGGDTGVERCSACPYAYKFYSEGIPGFMKPTKEGITICEEWISPNGEVCTFQEGTFKDECCAKSLDEKINKDQCY